VAGYVAGDLSWEGLDLTRARRLFMDKINEGALPLLNEVMVRAGGRGGFFQCCVLCQYI
jgi:hypothetical protein